DAIRNTARRPPETRLEDVGGRDADAVDDPRVAVGEDVLDDEDAAWTVAASARRPDAAPRARESRDVGGGVRRRPCERHVGRQGGRTCAVLCVGGREGAHQHRRQYGESGLAGESPAAHSWMSSSARTRSGSGIVTPSALAVLRLMTSSNLVGCSIGRPAGFAPLRILSMNAADRLTRSGMLGP